MKKRLSRKERKERDERYLRSIAHALVRGGVPFIKVGESVGTADAQPVYGSEDEVLKFVFD